MTNSTQENRQSYSMNTFVASAAGAMIGAAAGMAAIALVDEKNRKTVAQNGSRLFKKAKKEVNQFIQPIVAEKIISSERKASTVKQDILDAETPIAETPVEA